MGEDPSWEFLDWEGRLVSSLLETAPLGVKAFQLLGLGSRQDSKWLKPLLSQRSSHPEEWGLQGCG